MVLEPTHCPGCPSPEFQVGQISALQSRKLLNYQTVVPEKIAALISRPEISRSIVTPQKRQEVGQIFLFVNSSGPINQPIEKALAEIRNRVAVELRSQGFTVLEVPANLELAEAILWANRRSRPKDVAVSIQTDAFLNPEVRGTATFYVAGNQERRQQAEQLIQLLLANVPGLVSRGARPDTATAFGRLAFTRQITVPSLVLTVGFETNPLDRAIILERPQAIAQGIANGLVLWNRNLSGNLTPRSYPPINVRLDGQVYSKQGVIVNNHAYIPVDLLNRLEVKIIRPKTVRLMTYGNVAYVRAIDLRASGVWVAWNPTNRTVSLQVRPFDPQTMGRIIGRGYLQKETLEAFLRQVNSPALERFPDIVRLYWEEAAIEGVNPEIAFAQALLETNFFRFGGEIQPSQNNFGALRAAGGRESASFPNARIGVRAHIQLLKAYASLEPIVQDIVVPRFRFITRGIAPRVEQLSRRYSANPTYGVKTLAILRHLYQSVGLL